MRRFALVISFLVPLTAGAQSVDLPPGTPLRVDAPGQRRVLGRFIDQSDDSLRIMSNAGLPRSFAVGDISRLRRSDGRTRWAGARNGMKIGAVAGSVLGAFAANEILNEVDPSSGDVTGTLAPVVVPYAMISGALAGVVYGAAIGAIVKAHRWTTIVPGSLRVAVRPLKRSALGVGLSLDF